MHILCPNSNVLVLLALRRWSGLSLVLSLVELETETNLMRLRPKLRPNYTRRAPRPKPLQIGLEIKAKPRDLTSLWSDILLRRKEPHFRMFVCLPAG